MLYPLSYEGVVSSSRSLGLRPSQARAPFRPLETAISVGNAAAAVTVTAYLPTHGQPPDERSQRHPADSRTIPGWPDPVSPFATPVAQCVYSPGDLSVT